MTLPDAEFGLEGNAFHGEQDQEAEVFEKLAPVLRKRTSDQRRGVHESHHQWICFVGSVERARR